MNRVGENFPRSTTTVLSVGIEYSISKSGVSGSDRTLVGDAPSLDLLKSQPEQRSRRRTALAQEAIQFAEEGGAVAVIVIQNHDNRIDAGRPAKSPQNTRQPIEKDALVWSDSSFQVLWKFANPLVAVDVPSVWISVRTNDLGNKVSEQQLSGLVFHQDLDVHLQFTSR